MGDEDYSEQPKAVRPVKNLMPVCVGPPSAPGDARSRKAVESGVHIEEGPPVYKIDIEPSQALVIHCGDRQFQTAFRAFITKELDIKSYTPIIIGGGIHAFGVQSLLPKNFKILWQQIRFYIKSEKLREVIVINHEGCTWYKKMEGYNPTIKLPMKGKVDLKTAAGTILREFGGVRVRTFWAGLDGTTITFEETG